MATALDLLTQRQQEDWIHIWDYQGKLRSELTAQSIATDALHARDWLVAQDWSHCDRLPGQTSSSQPVIILATDDPALFLAWFSAITSLGYPLFLGDPTWSLNHWQQVALGLAPQLVITNPGWKIPDSLTWNFQPLDASPAHTLGMQSFPQLLTSCGKHPESMNSLGFSDPQPIQTNPKPVESLRIGIPTGGSSGQLKFALHSWNSLKASVTGLQLSNITSQTGQINSCCTLPLHHVSGLMQFLRSLISGGQLRLLPWIAVKAYCVPFEDSSIGNESKSAGAERSFTLDLGEFFISLVPTQLQRLLDHPKGYRWLAQFNTVLLGGAPAWPALLERARRHAIHLAPTYGMTETASQIMTLHPDDFLQGQSGCGKLLPHAQVEWLADPAHSSDRSPGPQGATANSTTLATGTAIASTASSGVLVVRARSLALGYYSIQSTQGANPAVTGYSGSVELWSGPADATDAARRFVTDDLVRRDDQGFFHVIGRASDKIISGGENIFPASVEAAILATGLVKDAVVLGIADQTWGERVVAIVVPVTATDPTTEPSPVAAQLAVAIAPALSPAQRPKQWHFVQAIPRSAQGKLQRQQLRDWLASNEQSQLTQRSQ